MRREEGGEGLHFTCITVHIHYCTCSTFNVMYIHYTSTFCSLSGNFIGDRGALAVAESLRVNHSLQSLE